MFGMELNGEQSVETILSQGTDFTGEVESEESIRINGIFDGTIDCERTLIIGPDAEINGEINTHSAVIGGVVRGDVNASNKIALRGNGEVYGDLTAPELQLERGVVLEGECTINADRATEESEKVTSIEQKLG